MTDRRYREPFFHKVFAQDCPRCGDPLYCDVTVGPGLSVGTLADGTAELTIHAHATPQAHVCAVHPSAEQDAPRCNFIETTASRVFRTCVLPEAHEGHHTMSPPRYPAPFVAVDGPEQDDPPTKATSAKRGEQSAGQVGDRIGSTSVPPSSSDVSSTGSDEFPPFGAIVYRAGGGVVDLVVDRDAQEYPPDGAHVRVTPFDSVPPAGSTELLRLCLPMLPAGHTRDAVAAHLRSHPSQETAE